MGETDGVSLEMDKWKRVLENMGHRVYYIAGSEGTSEACVIKEMYYHDAYDALLNKACFEELGDFTQETLQAAIEDQSEKVKLQLIRLFRDLNIDLVIPNNLLCLGRSPHIAMALTEAVLETEVDIIGHHHDFYWEREYFENPTTDYVKRLLDTYFPPVQLTHMRHVVINSLAKEDLKRKKGVEAAVVPNVFDYEMPAWGKDGFNSTYKKDMGITENTVVFLQATRVTNRKAIELAIDLIAVLNEPRYRDRLLGQVLYNGKVFDEETELLLVLVGLHEGAGGYEDLLIRHAKAKGVKMLVHPELVDHRRHMSGARKVYALWDAYVFCDIITYPSIYEGWGNQFLEGLFARRPQVIYEYEIFESDIKAFGFDYISLGNDYTLRENGFAKVDRENLEKAADKTIEYLINPNLYKNCVERNFEIAKEHLSMDTLERIVRKLITI